MADDLGYGDIEPFGQTKIKTPNLARMADEGMRFTQHYAGSPVCAPSRSVLMTGLHTGHTPVRGNKPHLPIGNYPLPDSSVTVAEILQKADYKTGAFGKWGLGYPNSSGMPSNQGFDTFFGYIGQRRAHFYYPEFLFRDSKGEELERIPLEGNEVDDNPNRHPGAGPPIKKEIYSQDIITDKALEFLNDNKEDRFFLYLPYNIPHASIIAPRNAMLPYIENGESIFPEDPFHGGHYTRQQTPHAAYAAMVTLMDKYIGRIMDKLEKEGIAGETLVIFTSDNGHNEKGGYDGELFDSNGDLRGKKKDVYEGGIRVPTIAWWPGTIQAGTTSNHISAFWDMLPTFADLAGVDYPSYVDGISMAPTLTGEGQQKQHDYLYWEFAQQGGKQAVRMGKWKGVRVRVKEDEDAPIRLYNLEEDRKEWFNVSNDHPDVVEKIRDIMKNARTPSRDFNVLGK